MISTDSEGVNSPPYLSPDQQPINTPQSQSTHINYSAAAASLVAVLSDDPLPSSAPNIDPILNQIQNEYNETASPVKVKKDKLKPKAEPIKLKIKTNARFKNTSEQLDKVNDIETTTKSTRSTPQQQQQNVDDSNIPTPGTANYELYRTLTDHSPTYQRFDSQNSAHVNEPSSIAGQSLENDAQNNLITERSPNSSIVPKKRQVKAKTKLESNSIETIVEEPIPKRQRSRRKHDEQPQQLTDSVNDVNTQINSDEPLLQQHQRQHIELIDPQLEKTPKKRITAAAKKQYKDSDTYLPIEVPNIVQPTVSETVINEEAETAVTVKRGRKPKGKIATQITTKTNQTPPEELPQQQQRTTRTTRHTANGNMMQVRNNFKAFFFIFFVLRSKCAFYFLI